MIIKSLSDQVYDYILRKIRIGELKHEDKIEENVLMDELGVSRTPIREALIQLCSDNFLENRPRKGYYVKLFSKKELDDMWDIIGVLDAHALELVINNGHVDDSLISRLNECVEEIDKAINGKDYEAYYQWQEEFHLIYQSRSGNSVLEKELKALLKRTLRMTYYSKDQDKLFQQLIISNKQHKSILEAIKANDADEAKAIAKEHWTVVIGTEE